jgi:ribose/xylose/arabinose/galactoside ABC-type transport system permease subunit
MDWILTLPIGRGELGVIISTFAGVLFAALETETLVTTLALCLFFLLLFYTWARSLILPSHSLPCQSKSPFAFATFSCKFYLIVTLVYSLTVYSL